MAANNDTLLVRLETDAPLDLMVTVSVPQSATKVSGHAPWVLPTEGGTRPSDSGRGPTMAYAAREGVAQVDNNVVLNTCARGGQHARAQAFEINLTDARVTLGDGRCLILAGKPLGSDCNNSTRRITVGECGVEGSGWVYNASIQQLTLTEADGGVFFAGPPAVPAPAPLPTPPGYTSIPGAVGGQSHGGYPLCKCTSVSACPAEAAVQCNRSADCRSFAVYQPGPHGSECGW